MTTAIRRTLLSADAERALRACAARPCFLDPAMAVDLHDRELILPVGERAGRLIFTASLRGLLFVYSPGAWLFFVGNA